MDKKILLDKVNAFKKLSIAVIGDFIADEYILGMTSRVSREAPVLILKYDSTILTLGGGGNAANNIHSIGARVIPVTVLGRDEMGLRLVNSIKKQGIDTSGIMLDPDRITATKTRIMAGGKNTTKQQVIRIDRETSNTISKETEDKLIKYIYTALDTVDAVIVSDYGLGVITDKVIALINEIAQKEEAFITVDSRFKLDQFKGITAATPNTEEIEFLCSNTPLSNTHEKDFCLKFIKDKEIKGMLITKGKEGMTLYESSGEITNLDIYGSDQIADVTGAGDTVISIFTMAIASGLPMSAAAELSNYGGGIVVMKRGTGIVTLNELKETIQKDY